MRIVKASFSRDRLLESPQAERALFLGLGHLANEISALNKLMLWASETPPRNDAESDARLALVLILVRLLAGKLTEGWQLIHKSYYGSQVSRAYDSQLPQEARETLKAIKKYFTSANLVSSIRNSFSFHYSPHAIDAALPHISESLHLYMEEGGTSNNLYYFAELATANAMLSLAVTEEDPIGYLRLLDELSKTAHLFAMASDHLMTHFLRLHGPGIWEGTVEVVSFPPLPKLLDIHLPWFTDPTEAYLGSA